MGKKREQKIEYKETEVFELFPDFTYTPLQKKRVILFHDYANHARKIINYAANFDVGNKICLVYLVGEPKAGLIESALESAGCSDRVCVLTCPFPDDAMQVWRDYDELRKQKNGGGTWDEKKDEPSAWYLDEKKKLLDYYAGSASGQLDGQIGMLGETADVDYTFAAERVAEYENIFKTLDKYRKLRSKCGNGYFKNFRLHRRGRLEKPYTHDRLDKLIQSVFPKGAEASGVNTYVSLSPASIAPAIAWAVSGEPNKKTGLTEQMIAPAVKAITELITKRIAESGFCTLMEIREVMESPPFGLGYDGFSAACVTKALVHFENRTLLFYDGCGHHRVKEIKTGLVDLLCAPDALNRRLRRRSDACLYLESQPHKKVKQFMAELWGVKIEMPGSNMGLHLAKALCKDHRVPLAYVDERLLRLTLWTVDFWNRKQVAALADEIASHGQEIRDSFKRYQYENAHVPPNAMTFLTADYSWVWNREEYERILWQSEKYGAWPWTQETQRAARAEEERRRKEAPKVGKDAQVRLV